MTHVGHAIGCAASLWEGSQGTTDCWDGLSLRLAISLAAKINGNDGSPLCGDTTATRPLRASSSGGSSLTSWSAGIGSRIDLMTSPALLWLRAETVKSTFPERMRRMTYSAIASEEAGLALAGPLPPLAASPPPPLHTGHVLESVPTNCAGISGGKRAPPSQVARRNSSPSAKSHKHIAHDEYSQTSWRLPMQSGMSFCKSSSSRVGFRRLKHVVTQREKRSKAASRSSGGRESKRLTSSMVASARAPPASDSTPEVGAEETIAPTACCGAVMKVPPGG
eukprot:CAMPEP_0170241224 /NCGR_PEP_ID=MMETSP0116_2-20130129/20376_1 /TAXON_ID=400756 /ORGANISM="Durinskia baltica, Strain CSIRO CS-38" /LENGTH=278 /DNA_ID=CAMNT_0010492055 /DNA_START=66 /DNA_END=902 /DNA_ORIENTATION=+